MHILLCWDLLAKLTIPSKSGLLANISKQSFKRHGIMLVLCHVSHVWVIAYSIEAYHWNSFYHRLGWMALRWDSFRYRWISMENYSSCIWHWPNVYVEIMIGFSNLSFSWKWTFVMITLHTNYYASLLFSRTYLVWRTYSVEWFYKVCDYIWKFDHYIVKIYDIFSVFTISYTYLVFKYHFMVYFNWHDQYDV